MKYIRTKDGRIVDISFASRIRTKILKTHDTKWILEHSAENIEELIQIGDIVFYWVPSYQKEHCVMITSDIEIQSLKYNAITKLLIPVGEDYKCVAKGFPSFNLIGGRKYLVNKGELELL